MNRATEIKLLVARMEDFRTFCTIWDPLNHLLPKKVFEILFFFWSAWYYKNRDLSRTRQATIHGWWAVLTLMIYKLHWPRRDFQRSKKEDTRNWTVQDVNSKYIARRNWMSYCVILHWHLALTVLLSLRTTYIHKLVLLHSLVTSWKLSPTGTASNQSLSKFDSGQDCFLFYLIFKEVLSVQLCEKVKCSELFLDLIWKYSYQ